MVHAASLEIVAVTAYVPRLAQRASAISSKRSEQAGARATLHSDSAAFRTGACRCHCASMDVDLSSYSGVLARRLPHATCLSHPASRTLSPPMRRLSRGPSRPSRQPSLGLWTRFRRSSCTGKRSTRACGTRTRRPTYGRRHHAANAMACL